MKLYVYPTLIGNIGIVEHAAKITRVYLNNEVISPELALEETALIQEAFLQLSAYFAGKLKDFSLPLAPNGTPFMLQVWQQLCAVPYGKTASYREIAIAIGNPKAVRAIGQANHRNPLPIFIPCHRIIGNDGKLVGYSGGLQIKQQLLSLERQFSA